MVDQNQQKDFFLQNDDIRDESSKRFFKDKPIKKNRFTVTLSYEIISMIIIGIVIFMAFFFYLGTLIKVSGREDLKIQERVEVHSEKKLPDIEVRPNVDLPKTSKDDNVKPEQLDLPDKVAIESTVEKQLESGYVLQVATFKSDIRAKKEMAFIRSLGYDSFDAPSGEYHQIRIGPFAEKEEALKIKEQLKDRYKDSFLRKLKSN